MKQSIQSITDFSVLTAQQAEVPLLLLQVPSAAVPGASCLQKQKTIKPKCKNFTLNKLSSERIFEYSVQDWEDGSVAKCSLPQA